MNDIEEAIEVTNRQINELKSELKTLETQEYIDSFNLAIKVKELSVEAMQEKLEREKGCEYCNCSTTEFEITVSDTVDFCKYCPHEKCLNDYGNDDCYGVGFKCIETEYCPKCGRKLGEENG